MLIHNLRESRNRVWRAVTLLLVLIVPQSGLAKEPRPFTFSVVGDTPYRLAHAPGLREDVISLDDRSSFLVHLGDIKSDEELCTDQRYRMVADILRQTPIPVFITPGDNEFNDCANPVDAWGLWEKHFLRFERHWTEQRKGRIDVHRQRKREENFAFVLNGVVFVGLHVPGGRVHDKADWQQRGADNISWMEHWLRQTAKEVSSAVVFSHAFPLRKKHPGILKALIAQAEAFTKPVLYIHGDGHFFRDDQPFSFKNFRRIQIRGLTSPPIFVTVTHDRQDPFIINYGRLGTGKK